LVGGGTSATVTQPEAYHRRPVTDRDPFQGYKAAIEADPGNPAGYVRFAAALYGAGLTEEARRCLDIGMAQIPYSVALRWCRAMTALPMVFASADEIDAARIEFAERLTAIKADWQRGRLPVQDAAASVGVMTPFHLAYQGRPDRALQKLHGALAAEIMATAYPRWARPVRQRQVPHNPIRIGIIGGIFWRHSVWRLPVRGWVEHLDRHQFRLFGYHTRPERDDQTKLAARLFDRFVQGPRSLPEWGAIIERDQPHVLLFPELGMEEMTFRLACLRIAPVQATSWGHPVTSGLPTIDAFLSSDLMESENGQDEYTEQLVRLPGLGTVYRPEWAAWGDPLPAGDSWADLDVLPSAVRFICCQAPMKYLPPHDDLYPRIASHLPEARFLFVERHPGVAARLRQRLAAAFARHGLDVGRFCRFTPGRPHGAFSALIRDADVFPDTVGWSGCNTTLGAVGHGVPIVTIPGRFMRGRHSTAILTAVGATDTIAASIDQYVRLAVRLGRDPAWRRHIGARLRAGTPSGFNSTTPIRALEAWLRDAVYRATQEQAHAESHAEA